MITSKVLAVDWDSQELRILEAAVGLGEVRLRRAAAFRFPDNVWSEGPEAVGEFIRLALREQGIRARRTVAALPRGRVILKNIPLPPMPADEVAAAIGFQAAKIVSFPIEEGVVDYVITSRNEEDKVDGVLVAIARRDIVEQYQDVCRAAGLKLAQLGLRPVAGLRAFGRVVTDRQDRVLLVVDIGNESAEINVVRNQQLLFSRSVALSGYHYRAPADAETAPEDDPGASLYANFLNEVQRTVTAYRSQQGTEPIEGIYLAEGGIAGRQLGEQLAERLRLPVDTFDPRTGVDAVPAFKLPPRSFAAPLGMLQGRLRGARPEFDFLSPKQAVTRRDPRKMIAAAAVAAVAILGVWGYMSHRKTMAEKRSALAELKIKINALKPDHEKLMKLQKRIVLVNREVDAGAVWLDELRRMTDLFRKDPKDAVCRSVSFAVNTKTGRTRFRKYIVGETKEGQPLYPDRRELFHYLSPQGKVQLGTLTVSGVIREYDIYNQLRQRLIDSGFYMPIPGPPVNLQSGGNRDKRYPLSFKLPIQVYRPEAQPEAPAEEKPKADDKKTGEARS